MIHLLVLLYTLLQAALKTNAGRDFQSRVMGQGGAAGAGTGNMRPADYIAVTENATAPAAGDTTLTGELTTDGFARAQAAYAHTAGASTYTLTKTFTNTGVTTRTLNKIGVFNAAASGDLVFEEVVPSPVAQLQNDALAITVTVTI
jgi:hypothetical protein